MSLDVLRRRDDGYHELLMIMQTVDLCDELTLTFTDAPVFSAGGNMPFLPSGESNLAVKAASLYFRAAGISGGVSIYIKKRIPVRAGLGGGSADAAAVLRALNRHFGKLSKEDLYAAGLACGSDVPFCLRGGTQLAKGRGEVLSLLPELPDCDLLICKPQSSVSTAEAFGGIQANKLRCHPDTDGLVRALETGDIANAARRMYNVFQEPVSKQHREIRDIYMCMLQNGALGASMSGTGSAVTGLFAAGTAGSAYGKLRGMYRDTFLTKPKGVVM